MVARPNIIVEQYGVENGMPNNIVYCSLKDRDGFMWFGTWYGLCSFDGHKFTSYNNSDRKSSDIPPQKIENIVEDKNGYLWIKTVDRKLYVFNRYTEQFHAVYNNVKDYVSNIQVIKIQKTDDGEVLLLTKDKNLLSSFETSNDKVELKLLHNASQDINPQDSRLKYNVFFETNECIGWIGRDYSILTCNKSAELRKRGDNFLTAKLGANSLTAFSSVIVEGNSLWLGDYSGTLFQADYITGNTKKIKIPAISGAIKSMFVDKHGLVFFVAEGQGLYSYNLKNNQLKRYDVPFNSAEKITLFIDKADKLWLVENDQTIVYIDTATGYVKRFPTKNSSVFTTFKYQDAGSNGIFFLTSTGDLLMFDRNDLSMTALNQLKPFADIVQNQLFFSLLLDKDGILWVVSTSKGVYRINMHKNQFNLLGLDGQPAGEPRIGVRAMFEDKNHNIWVGNRDATLYKLNSKGEIVNRYDSDKNNVGSAYHITQAKDDNLWVSTKGNGFLNVNPNTENTGEFIREHYKNNPNDSFSLSNNDVYYSYTDSKGRVWVGTMGGGLNLMDTENGKTVFRNKLNSFKKYPEYGLYMEVRNIVEDQDGRIWVGTTDGLMSFDGNFSSPDDIEFETYRNRSNDSNIADNDIYVLYKDSRSQIWVSVFGGGLNRLVRYDKNAKQPVFETFGNSTAQNIYVIISIIEDKQGYLWLVTESGLSRYDTNKKMLRNFDKFDGLLTVKLEENSGLMTSKGQLWLGCREGILTYNPSKISSSIPQHETYIVDFKISNKELSQFKNQKIVDGVIKYANTITLNHDQSMFSLEFAALNYYDQNRISYKYILDGYEKEWHFNGKNRNASYSNIPPGKYLFRVISMDEAAPDSISERTLQIIVLPPWWRTWWAYTIYSILIIGLIIFGIRLFYGWTKMKNEVYISDRLSELKIKFFTNISHELRTPLSLIKGPIQEIKEKEKLTSKGKEYIQLMEHSTNQMQQLVNQLLDFRKIQNGKMKLHVSLFDLVEFMPYFQKEFHILAVEKKIKYTFTLPESPVNIWADRDRLGIVIRNVISNAFKYTPEGGEIAVTLKKTDSDKKILIQISDTGIGIEKNKLQEIFERFVQGSKEYDFYSSGTGIGLALSKEIVFLHHGTIIAENNPSQGAVFSIELQQGKEHFSPNEVEFYLGDQNLLKQTEPQAATNQDILLSELNEENDSDDASDKPVLLLVEDNRDMARMVKLQLEDKYKVYLAENGVEGLKKIHLHQPDIVVTDQMMPEMDGIELLTQIRQDFQISHIPVIILTAKDGEEAKTNAITKGANAYITKPFSKDYLIARIDQLLHERKMFRDRLWQQRDTTEPTNNYEEYLETKDMQLLEQINNVILDNLDNSDFNIDTIATTIGLSRSAFFKKLKSLTGLAPVDLVKEIRLNKSLELLKNPDLSISEVAYAVGFKESGYYTKCFRKKYNQTPREYIAEWRKS